MTDVMIGKRWMYEDYGLVLSSKIIRQPEPKLRLIESDGADGTLDATPDPVRFGDREITMNFSTIAPRDAWGEIRRKVLGRINGQRTEIYFSEDPEYHYVGRCVVDEPEESKRSMLIPVTAYCDPFIYGNKALSISSGLVTGSAPSIGRLQATLAEDATRIEMQCGEKSVTLNGEFKAGQALEFDLRSAYITVDSKSAMPFASLYSRFDLPGPCESASEIEVTADNKPVSWIYTYTPRWY